jgi:hypothetical protein
MIAVSPRRRIYVFIGTIAVIFRRLAARNTSGGAAARPRLSLP